MSDGSVTRLDEAVLLLVWVVGTVWFGDLPGHASPHVRSRRHSGGYQLHKAMFGLGLVGLGATTAIQALTTLAELWTVPECLIAPLRHLSARRCPSWRLRCGCRVSQAVGPGCW